MPLPFLLLTINGQVDFDQITTPHSLWDDDFKDYTSRLNIEWISGVQIMRHLDLEQHVSTASSS